MAQSMPFANKSGATMGSPLGAPSSMGHVVKQGSASTTQESDGEEDGNGNSGADGKDEEDADAQALSGVAKLTMEPGARVTGSSSGSDGGETAVKDSVMVDDFASAGAEQSSTADASDDNDYTGLSALSDDGKSLDGDEDAILEAAEEDLKKEFLAKEQRDFAAGLDFAREDMVAPENDFDITMGGGDDDPLGLGAEINLDEDPFQGAQLFDSTWQDMWGAAEMDMWRMPNADRHDEGMGQSNARTKRVRFQDGVESARSPSRSSSSSGSDDEDEADKGSKHFPDIFMDQEDPKIKKLLASDFDDDIYGHDSDAGSVYDFDDDADKFAFDMDEESDSSSDESDSESDDDEAGYETEDDTLEEKRAKMEQARKAMRASSNASASASLSAPATPQSSKRRPSTHKRSNSTNKVLSPSKVSKGPRKGTFFCDPTKATIVSDSTGKKTILYMPTEPSAKHKAFWDRARSAATSRDSSPRGSMSITLPSGDGKDDAPARPFTAQSTLATMFNGSFDFMQSNDMTPPARLAPRPSSQRTSFSQPSFTPAMSTFTSATTDEASDGEDEYQDFDMLINLDQDSDNDEPSWSAAPTQRNSPVEEPTFLSRGMVGSFRLNQDRAKQESSLPLDPASRASTSEHNALQSGRRGAGNTPITPARKKRVSKDLTRTGSGIRKPTTPNMSSPLASRRRSRGQSLSGRLDQTLAPGFNF